MRFGTKLGLNWGQIVDPNEGTQEHSYKALDLPDKPEMVGETRQVGSSNHEVLGALSFESGTPTGQR